MSDESGAREEAYMQKMMNRGKDTASAKKHVFGGGLEAARAKQAHGGTVQLHSQTPPPHQAYPPMLESEVVELTLPPPPALKVAAPSPSRGGGGAPPPPPGPAYKQAHTPTHAPVHPVHSAPPPIESEVVELSLPPISGVSKEEAQRKEEERMAKSIGRFVPPKASGGGTPPPPPQPQQHYQSVQHSPQHYSPAPPQSTHYQPPPPSQYHQSPYPTTTTSQESIRSSSGSSGGAQYNTQFESSLFSEIVQARQNPGIILDRLRERRRYYNGLDYNSPDLHAIIMTSEGVAAVDDAIAFVSKQQPIKTKLKLEDGLSLSARDFCDILKNTTQPNESQQDAKTRLTRYGTYIGDLSQNVAFSDLPPSHLLMDWIIDDGQRDADRPHRRSIFDSRMNVVGVASGPNQVGRVVVVLFAQEYQSKVPHVGPSQDVFNNVSSSPPPKVSSSNRSASPARRGDDFVYPKYEIGALSPIDSTANMLPITSLACGIHEIYVGIRQNGKRLEIKRSVTQNGKPRVEGQSLTLPYQVTLRNVSATYYPNKNNGELQIRLGKDIPLGSSSSEIARFTVRGVPNSPHQRVNIEVNQTSDHITFSPSPPTPYTTDFVVLISGSALEFKSTYTLQEGEGLKTVNYKQTIQLPIPPTPEQIDVAGDKVTLWPNRREESDIVVPDSDVVIAQG